MPAGVAIPLISAGIGAATTIYSAKKQADSAKEAAATQVQGTKDAQAYIDKGYQQGQAALSPWLTTGGAAATTLGGLMGLPMAPQGGTSAPPTPPNVGGTTPNLGNLRPTWSWPAVNQDTGPVDRDLWRDQRIQERRDQRLGTVMSPTGSDPVTAAMAQTQTGYTKMKAPDGTEEMVPAQYVNHYTKLGAQVLG